MRFVPSLIVKLFLVTAVVTLGRSLRADEPVKHRIVFAEYGNTQNRLCEVDADGKLVWEYKPASITVIFTPLANGNIVFAYGGHPTGVAEVNHKSEIVWNFESKSPQVLGCSRLADGNTIVGEQGPCQALEVAPDLKVLHTTPLITSETNTHLQVRSIHKLPNGNILAAFEGEGAIREVDADGKLVWEYLHVDNCGDALRLDNGNTVITCGTQKRLIEVTPAGEVVWEFGPKDAPELNLTWVGSVQRLKNGNYVCNNFLRGQEGKGVHAFEVTKEKKVVWTFADHAMVKSMATVRVIDDN